MPHGSAQLLGGGWKSNRELPGSQCEMGKQPDLKMAVGAFALLPGSIQGNSGGHRILASCFLVRSLK